MAAPTDGIPPANYNNNGYRNNNGGYDNGGYYNDNGSYQSYARHDNGKHNGWTKKHHKDNQDEDDNNERD